MKTYLLLKYIKIITHPLTFKSLSLLILMLSYRYYLINTIHAESYNNFLMDPLQEEEDAKKKMYAALAFGAFVIFYLIGLKYTLPPLK